MIKTVYQPMRKIGFSLIVISFFIILTNCGKTIEETHPEFIGFWKSKTENGAYTFTFNNDGSGKHSFVGNGKMKNNEGRFRVKDTRLSVGLKHFEINTFPYQGQEYMEMTIDKIDYFKVNN